MQDQLPRKQLGTLGLVGTSKMQTLERVGQGFFDPPSPGGEKKRVLVRCRYPGFGIRTILRLLLTVSVL